MKLDLSGKKALVTGAGRGIGLAVTQALTAAGAEVTGGARTITPELTNASAHTVQADLATPEGPAMLVEQALKLLGGIDILVNNVGGGVKMVTGFLDADDETWQRTFDQNVFSLVRTTRAALPSLVERKGAIVNIGSINARLADPRLVHYSAAKAAVANIGKALSAEFSPLGVRVNTISPGPVRTRIWTDPAIAAQLGLTSEEFLASVPAMMGLSTGSIIDPSEIATLVVVLASGLVPSVTGADYLIDAGMAKGLG
jgi:NAD(P)-dependent dehydrogenase (short-subunit alcohol dehydrogenase family)